jgi:hypothetical protein
MQVVVAEHGHRAVAQALHEAQAAQRIGTAVDEIADEPETVAGGVESDPAQQRLERREAALQVADRVGRQDYLAAATM